MDANRRIESSPVPALMQSANALADQFLAHVSRQDAASHLRRSGIITQLQKQLAECMLAAELRHHLQTLNAQGMQTPAGNYRNGSTPKNVFTPSGVLELAIPRVRFATFEPRLIPRYQRRLPGFDEGILALFARGFEPERIRAHLQTLYPEDAWPILGDVVTEDVLAHVRQWQTRELEYSSPVVYFDTLHVPVRSPEEMTEARLHFALGTLCDGSEDVFGFWTGRAPGALLWQHILLELRNRGLSSIRTIAGDGLQGLEECAAVVYPAARFAHPPRS